MSRQPQNPAKKKKPTAKAGITCENCGKKISVDLSSLPPMNPIALRATKTGTREIYVDCPYCGGETVAEVPLAPISQKNPPARPDIRKRR